MQSEYLCKASYWLWWGSSCTLSKVQVQFIQRSLRHVSETAQSSKKMMTLQYAGWSLRGRQAESSKLELQLRAVPSSLTSTYKLFILPLHVVAISFHVPASAKYDCCTYLPVSQKGRKASWQPTLHAKGQSTSSVVSIVIYLNFDWFCSASIW